MNIRPEQVRDIPFITKILESAFRRPDEAELVEQLRADGDVAVSLVADADGVIVGHVLLSNMTAPFKAAGLAPLAVRPSYQNKGIGSMLIRTAIGWARAQGYAAIFAVGNPDYYSRFGFRADLTSGFSSPYAGPYLMVLPIGGPLPVSEGEVAYPAAFSRLS